MTDKALDKKIETLRALLGQSKDSTQGLTKSSSSIEDRKEPSLSNAFTNDHYGSSSDSMDNKMGDESLNSGSLGEFFLNNNSLYNPSVAVETIATEEGQVKPLPTATKTFTARDFLHFKKHSNEQSMVLIKRFLSKHGKPEKNSSELHALTNAINRIITNRQKQDLEK